jgi:hypothetical protein
MITPGLAVCSTRMESVISIIFWLEIFTPDEFKNILACNTSLKHWTNLMSFDVCGFNTSRSHLSK